MERVAHLLAGAADATDHWKHSPSGRRAYAAQEHLRHLGALRANLLFIGADEVVWRVLATSLELASPLVSWRPGEPMDLPDPARVRTLIIREVGTMTVEEQLRLLPWLTEASGRTQVVCTASESLLPLLQTGSFNSALYYRLNIVCLDLTF